MKKIKIAVVAAVVLSLSVLGCAKGSDSTVLARVNRAKITIGDFKKQMEDLPPQMQQAVMTDPKARKDFLDDLIGIEIVLQEARRQGLDRDAEFKKKQEMMRKEKERWLEEQTKNELFSALLKKELMGKVSPPTDEEVKEFYTAHRDEIKKAAGGKDLTLKQAEAQGLKDLVYRKKQRDAYIEYTKGLKKNAKIEIDEKALDAAMASLAQPSMQKNPQVTAPAAAGDSSKGNSDNTTK